MAHSTTEKKKCRASSFPHQDEVRDEDEDGNDGDARRMKKKKKSHLCLFFSLITRSLSRYVCTMHHIYPSRMYCTNMARRKRREEDNYFFFISLPSPSPPLCLFFFFTLVTVPSVYVCACAFECVCVCAQCVSQSVRQSVYSNSVS